MRLQGFRCDECKKEHLLDGSLMIHGVAIEYLPASWFAVIRGQQNREREPYTLCSVECLRAHSFKPGEDKA